MVKDFRKSTTIYPHNKDTPAVMGGGACPALTDIVKLNKAKSNRVGSSTDAVR